MSTTMRKRQFPKKDRVLGTAFLQARSHTVHLDGEASVTQALLELPILPGGPDR